MTSRTALLMWYIDRRGRITYSSTERCGPDSYDSASAMFSALIEGGFLPKGSKLGTMTLLYELKNVLLHEIPRHEIQRGDIFISGFEKGRLTEYAYCGAVLDYHHVIYCIESANGIVCGTNQGWSNRNVRWYRLSEPFDVYLKPLRRENNERKYVRDS